MRNLRLAITVFFAVLTAFCCRAVPIARNSNSFNPELKRLESFTRRYAIPENDHTLSAKLPLTFGYRFSDDYGTMQSREEKMDPDGSKTGFYSFVDASGLFRRVEYVADGKGFRATVTTNEPGTVSSEPAHVRVLSENGRNAFRHAIQNSPQLEYSSKIFSRYNSSSDLIHDKDRFINPQGNTDVFKENSFFDKSAVFGPNFEELSSPKDSSFVNTYKGSALPLRSILPLSPKYPEILDPKFQEFNLEKYFNKPDSNSDYVFGDKLSNKDFEKDYTAPLYGSKLFTNSQSSTGKRYPRRHRDSRARAKRRHVLKIHIPEGYEDHPDLPLYRDK